MSEIDEEQDTAVCGEPHGGQAGPKLSPDPGCGRLKGHEGPHLIQAVFGAGRSPRSWEWGAGVDQYEEGTPIRKRLTAHPIGGMIEYRRDGAFWRRYADGTETGPHEQFCGPLERILNYDEAMAWPNGGAASVEPEADPEARGRAILRAELDRPAVKKGGAQ